MTAAPEIRVYDYVNHPYEEVRAALAGNAAAVFEAATKSAASRARSVASQLHVDLGVIGVETAIDIAVRNVEQNESEPMSAPVTRLAIDWQASAMPALFPLMKAELAIYPLTSTETQLDFFGVYKPPLGALGKVVNAAVGHRIAEASVHRFVSDVAGYLRRSLA